MGPLGGGGGSNLRGIIGHVAAVLGTGLAVGGEQLFQFGAGGVVQGQAAPFEVLQREGGPGVGGIEGGGGGAGAGGGGR